MKETDCKQLDVQLKELPEVKEVLDKHLDKDHEPSLAIRSVYGRWLPWLVLLDSSWVKETYPNFSRLK
jgi:hypothetical protein